MKKLEIFLVGSILLCGLSCKKRDRLTTSNVSFAIVPPATSIVLGQTKVFQVSGRSASGEVATEAIWDVTPSSALNTTIGNTVTFSALALGDYTLTATAADLIATSHIRVVTYLPSASTYDVYSDRFGLPSRQGEESNINTLMGSRLHEISSGYTPDGSHYQQATNARHNDFWDVTVDSRTLGIRVNLTDYQSGYLKFAIRLGRELSASSNESLTIRVFATGGSHFETLATGSYGFDDQSTEWQEIAMPASIFLTAVDETNIRIPFGIRFEHFTSTGPLSTCDIDAVRWDKN